ncbi:hypothetical protein NC651_006118 [Populus alba x Populus x berolinensis]|nr:hypothetical protein NC651_006118 [Populus alba x Populus x berolinensis]
MIEAHLSDKTVTVILILNVVPKYLQGLMANTLTETLKPFVQ